MDRRKTGPTCTGPFCFQRNFLASAHSFRFPHQGCHLQFPIRYATVHHSGHTNAYFHKLIRTSLTLWHVVTCKQTTALHHRLLLRTNALPQQFQLQVTFLLYPYPLLSISCVSCRHSLPPSFRPLLHVETDKYRSKHAFYSTIKIYQSCLSLLQQGQAQITHTKPTHNHK